MTLDEQLYGLELRLIRRVEDSYVELLCDEFVEFGSSGRAYTKEEVVRMLGSDQADEVRVSDFKVRMFAPGCALVTYRANTKRVAEGEFDSLRSSVWVYKDRGWNMCFHQGTRVTGEVR